MTTAEVIDFEHQARIAKAKKLAKLFTDKGVDVETLGNLDEEGWKLAAEIAGTKVPSLATRFIVISMVGHGVQS